jgi:glutaredoxin
MNRLADLYQVITLDGLVGDYTNPARDAANATGETIQTSANEPNCNTGTMSRRQVQLLTRAGCTICDGVHAQLKQLAEELDFDLSTTDIDAEAQKGDRALRAEFGDRLPVVLLDGREHSYWELDEPRLRKDLANR